jgi:ubiquinone/menaquinone biosynthesis C-methylase UbiE
MAATCSAGLGGGSFDRVADVYDATRAVPEEAAAAITRALARLLREASPAPLLLEVGIGTGRISIPLAAAGVRVVGVDVSARMVARLHEKRPALPVALADALMLPFRPGIFDAVLFVHLLHLVPDAFAAVRAARGVARAGGVLLLGRTDYAESGRGAAFRLMRETTDELAGHPTVAPPWSEAVNQAFRRGVEESGGSVAEQVVAGWAEPTTGRKLLADLAARVYASTWAIPDELMPELVRRLTPRLEALLGGLDRVVETGATFTIVAARLPR